MNHLESISSVACEAYLEHIIHHLGEEGSDFHEKLIELYLNDVRSSSQSSPPLPLPLPPADGMISADSSDSYTKLLDLLETSTAYRADRVLGRLPSDDMYQVRAILLGRLGRHEGALQIYVYQLSDHSTAEEYVSPPPPLLLLTLLEGTANEYTNPTLRCVPPSSTSSYASTSALVPPIHSSSHPPSPSSKTTHHPSPPWKYSTSYPLSSHSVTSRSSSKRH